MTIGGLHCFDFGGEASLQLNKRKGNTVGNNVVLPKVLDMQPYVFQSGVVPCMVRIAGAYQVDAGALFYGGC